jgi:hypothetical protein
MTGSNSPTTAPDGTFFEAVGRLTLAWAQTETILDLIVWLLHSQYGGAQVEPQLPIGLQRKIRYVNKCFRKVALLKPYATRMREVMDKYAQAAVLRHDMAHGMVLEHSRMTGETSLVRLIRENNGFIPRDVRATPEILRQHTEHINAVGAEGFIALSLLGAGRIAYSNQFQPLAESKPSARERILKLVRRCLPIRKGI